MKYSFERKPMSMKKFMIIALSFFVLVTAVVGMVLLTYVQGFLSQPGSLPARELEILVPPNVSFAEMSRQLESERVITDARRFTMLAEWRKVTGKLRSGRYLVNTGWTPGQVLDQLINGQPILDRVTLPEGLTWWQVGRRLDEARMVRFEDFEKVVHDPDFLRHHGIPRDSAEGYLFPDTYFIMRPLVLNEESARSVAGRLIDNFWRKAAILYPAGVKLTWDDRRHLASIVTLASIVEKETSVPGERATVAGVYANRLRRGMILQADPTIIYGIGPSFDGKIKRSDLQNANNPYNTYKHKGLPPGPICSPGLACLRAAMNPATHNFVYFVARGDGSHQFSETLEGHNRAVKLYRAAMREKEQQAE